MENIVSRKIELIEYIAPEGQVFKKVDITTDEDGNPQEYASYRTRMIGTNINIDEYELVSAEERDEYMKNREPSE